MSPTPQKKGRAARSVAERVSFAVSSAILALIVGAIGYIWANQSDPADVVVAAVADARQEGSRYYVQATVENRGDDTAEQVTVAADLTVPGEAPDVADQSIDFLSGGEEATVVFVFDRNPKDGELEIRVTGYRAP